MTTKYLIIRKFRHYFDCMCIKFIHSFLKYYKALGLGFLLSMISLATAGQEIINKETIYEKGEERLLDNALIQMEATAAVNDMYNFKFERATLQFNWFKEKYPEHPLPYFLLGLNEWWKMMPNSDIETYDDVFLNYMDLSIDKAQQLYKKDPENAEAAFFLAAAYAFKSRLHAERKHWTKATFNGKSSLKYLRKGKATEELSPELLLGDALYNYYSIWIPENYPMLKPIMLLFRKGDQALGLEQLKEVAQNAFYTRTEAQYFLMRIYRSDEKKPNEAFPIAEYLHQTFPDNAYFHRYYASILYVLGRIQQLENTSKEILDRIAARKIGYEAISGRYAAYYLAYVYKIRYNNPEKAHTYYQQTIKFTEETEHFESGYYHAALQQVAEYAHQKKDYKTAKEHYTLLKKYTKKKDKRHKEAAAYLKKYRKY